MRPKIFSSPFLEYIMMGLLIVVLGFNIMFHGGMPFLFLIALAGSIQTVRGAIRSSKERRVSIDTFNAFALLLSFATGEIQSAAFIALMLTSAKILDWHTASRSRHAIEELLKLKPLKASRERNGIIEEIAADEIKVGDIIVVQTGSRIPVDGLVIFGNASVNEASVSGESLPVQKVVGDNVLEATLNESGVIKIKARRVGKDSTLERMVALMKEASKNKSRSEKFADRFASFFLPILAIMGVATYLLTKNLPMTTALFLVACADDMAVAIPLATTASIGRAAKRGVVIKGGEWIEALSKMKILVLDKTGTLTYGTISINNFAIESHVDENKFWRLVAIAEKFSEHPIGRALFKEAIKYAGEIPDPDEFRVYKGNGVWARQGEDEIALGDQGLFQELGIVFDSEVKSKLEKILSEGGQTIIAIFINKKFSGFVVLTDLPRPEARESLARIKSLGVKRIIMFTGDNEKVAERISKTLGIEEFRASMSPEDKLRELEALEKDGPVVMLGDGINDAPALARADVGIAMGGGTAIAVEAADVVVVSDNLSRIPEIIILSRKTMGIMQSDILIWIFSNTIGFALVFTGIAGPAIAAFYNFATDFFPLINSGRLFGIGNSGSEKKKFQ